MVDIKKMEKEWLRKGFEREYVAQVMGITKETLRKKISGDRTAEITATQAYNVCEMLQSPLSMFIIKE